MMDATDRIQTGSLSYSVVIRTLGNSGEKYKALLKSIQAQTVQPEEVIVVIPEGYSLDYEMGNETVIHSERGMVSQRAVGIDAAKSEYILVVDDDIEFEADFVERLASFREAHSLDCVLPKEGFLTGDGDGTINLYYPLFTRIKYAFTGRMFQTRRKSRYIDVITATAGHKVYCGCNKLDECYYCQTGAFACYFINTAKAKQVAFNNEVWLQQGSLSSYAAYDDAAFFYLFYLLGYDIAYSLRTRFNHLDAAVGRPAKDRLEAKRIRVFYIARNRTVFWFRYLYQTSDGILRRIKVILGGIYAFVNYTLYNVLANILPKNWPVISALFIGYKEAFTIMRNNDLPPLNLKYRAGK